MPFRKNRRKFRKRPFRRNGNRNRKLIRKRYMGPIGRAPNVMSFTREIWSTLDLSEVADVDMGFPSEWPVARPTTDRVNFQPRINLLEIPSYTEISNLFGQYRISAMSVTFYPAHTTNYADGNVLTAVNYRKGINLLLFVKQNYTGNTETTLTEGAWGEITRKRTSIFCPGDKPTSVYSKTKVLSPTVLVDGTVTNASTAIGNMKWQSTSDTFAQNTCLTCSLATMDGSSLLLYTGGRAKFKIRTRVYFQARFVK